MFALALLSAPANAYVFIGNPTFRLSIDRAEHDLVSGDVDLLGVRVHACGGGYTDYYAEETIDPVKGWATVISGGNLCSVQVRWDSDGEVWSSAFSLKSSASISTVPLTGVVSTADWTPFTVSGGTFTGSDPYVRIQID